MVELEGGPGGGAPGDRGTRDSGSSATTNFIPAISSPPYGAGYRQMALTSVSADTHKWSVTSADYRSSGKHSTSSKSRRSSYRGELFSLVNDVSSVCTGSSNLFIGTPDGTVHIVSSAFNVVQSFRAYDAGNITHMKQIDGTSLLVTIAEDLSSEPVLKVWALDKPEKKTGAPRCLSTVSGQNRRRQFPISAFAALDDLSQLAVGFANGSVTIIRGDLINDRGARQHIVFESEEVITSLEVQRGPITLVYIATTSRILTLIIAGQGQGQPARVLEDAGCGVGCMALD
ncbi:hypothetical protein M432DRAFT_362841 [Thermoascus aurantiacus ATCC 26904]